MAAIDHKNRIKDSKFSTEAKNFYLKDFGLYQATFCFLL